MRTDAWWVQPAVVFVVFARPGARGERETRHRVVAEPIEAWLKFSTLGDSLPADHSQKGPGICRIPRASRAAQCPPLTVIKEVHGPRSA